MIQQTSSRRAQIILFAKNFIKHPKMLGSLIPSSRFLIRALLEPIDWERAGLIVEYGPGVGTISTELLKRMRADARLVVIETNQDFVEFLRQTVQDPRLVVVHGSAADVERHLEEHGLGKADYVISGIPFSTIPAPICADIARATHDALKPTGAFLIYQFSPAVLQHVEGVFGRIERGAEVRNVPPARLFFCSPRPAEPAVEELVRPHMSKAG